MASLNETTATVLRTIRGSRDKAAEFRNAMVELRAENISADLNEGVGDVESVIGVMIDLMKRMEGSLRVLLVAIAGRWQRPLEPQT